MAVVQEEPVIRPFIRARMQRCEEESMKYASYAVTLTADCILVDPLAIVFNE